MKVDEEIQERTLKIFGGGKNMGMLWLERQEVSSYREPILVAGRFTADPKNKLSRIRARFLKLMRQRSYFGTVPCYKAPSMSRLLWTGVALIAIAGIFRIMGIV